MSVLVALIVGLVIWIAAWSFGVKAFDAFLIVVALVVGAAAYRMMSPFLDQLMGRQTADTDQLGPGRG